MLMPQCYIMGSPTNNRMVTLINVLMFTVLGHTCTITEEQMLVSKTTLSSLYSLPQSAAAIAMCSNYMYFKVAKNGQNSELLLYSSFSVNRKQSRKFATNFKEFPYMSDMQYAFENSPESRRLKTTNTCNSKSVLGMTKFAHWQN